ncbi:MAG: hypothetical protein IJD32_04345 [Bacteroidaceae bacterium]|nr:hypothetical protein [Bacteroidaceae bacterium]
MKKFLFATFMGALVALAGCQQDDELTGVENTLGKKVSVTANIKANAQSRVALDYVIGEDGGYKIKVDWKESGESFLMYDATNPSLAPTIFRQTSDNQFEGTLSSESGPYYAEYGDDANLDNQDGTLNENYVWMKSDDITDLTQSIEFKHQTTVLMPNFIIDGKTVNAAITQIVMDGVPSSNGTITITPPQEDDTTTPSQGDNIITPSQATDMFIFLPASNGEIEAETPFKFTVTKDGKEYVAELSIGKSMIAGQFYTADIHLEEKTIPYVTFTADAEQTLKYTGNDLQYSLDGTTFQALDADEEIDFGVDVKLYLRGNDNLDGTKYNSDYGTISFTEEAHVACTGDIRTLIDYDNYENVSTNQAEFRNLFDGCIQLTSAPELPSTDLAEGCYSMMFYNCESLQVAPELPATTLAPYCYSMMFDLCSSLEEAPALQATTLAEGCYNMMFALCEALETAPALPATTLAPKCYVKMFMSCTSLKTAPALPAETLAEGCYELMFSNCTSLKVAPVLPATDLAVGCYKKMFNSCTSLESITMLATNISATDCLTDWVKDVPATGGTFTKNASATYVPSEIGIPTGWTVVEQ